MVKEWRYIGSRKRKQKRGSKLYKKRGGERIPWNLPGGTIYTRRGKSLVYTKVAGATAGAG